MQGMFHIFHHRIIICESRIPRQGGTHLSGGYQPLGHYSRTSRRNLQAALANRAFFQVDQAALKTGQALQL